MSIRASELPLHEKTDAPWWRENEAESQLVVTAVRKQIIFSVFNFPLSIILRNYKCRFLLFAYRCEPIPIQSKIRRQRR